MYIFVTVHTVIFLQVHFSLNDQIVGLTLFVKFTGNVCHYFQLVLETLTGAFFLVPQQSRFLESLSSLSIQVMARWELSLDIRGAVGVVSSLFIQAGRPEIIDSCFNEDCSFFALRNAPQKPIPGQILLLLFLSPRS